MNWSPPCGDNNRFDHEATAEAIRNRGLLLLRIELGGEGIGDDRVRDVIGQARKLGARKILLQGEPTIHPGIAELIRFIRGLEIDVELITKGRGIDGELARFFGENGVALILDAGGRPDAIRDFMTGGKGKEGDARKACDELIAAGYPAPDKPLAVAAAICRGTVDVIPTFWQWLRDRRIRPCFETCRAPGSSGEGDLADAAVETAESPPERVESLFLRLSEIDRERYGREWTPRPPLAGGRCLCLPVSCLIDLSGDVRPCAGVPIIVGNVRREPLAEILRDSEVLKDFREPGKTIRGPCAECALRLECYGCRGSAFAGTGDFLASDPGCWKNRDKLDRIERLPIPAGRVVPHGKPMLVIDTLLSVVERRAVAAVTVPAKGPFVSEEGALERHAYPELVAQAIAAMNGFRQLGSKEEHKGVLLGIKSFRIFGTAARGDTLTVSVFKAERFGNFGIVEGEVARDGVLLAKGEIKVWKNEKES
jgi:radical SAM protein with 4Fe4S-binding SPASM domain